LITEYLYRFTEDIDAISGQLLAVKKPPTYGEKGLTVTGEEILAILGDDFQMVAGKNTVISSKRVVRGYKGLQGLTPDPCINKLAKIFVCNFRREP